MKYMVMECHRAYAVLIDEEGRFVKAANRFYEVGQTVTDPILMMTPRRRFVPTLRTIRHAVIAMAACLLVVLGVARFASSPSPYASVVMTINPSVRIDVDKNSCVTDVTALNEDGKTLLTDVTIKNKTLVAVTDELLERAVMMGYLADNGTVRFSVQCDDSVRKARYEQTLIARTEVLSEGRSMIVRAEIKDADTSTVAPTEPIKTTAGTTTAVTETTTATRSTTTVTETTTVTGSTTTVTETTTVTGSTTTVTRTTTSATEPTSATTKSTKPTRPDDDDEEDDDEPIEELASYVGREGALAIVLEEIGADRTDVQEWDAELDEEDGIVVYEVDVTVNGQDFEYRIVADSGAVLQADRD